MIWWCI